MFSAFSIPLSHPCFSKTPTSLFTTVSLYHGSRIEKEKNRDLSSSLPIMAIICHQSAERAIFYGLRQEGRNEQRMNLTQPLSLVEVQWGVYFRENPLSEVVGSLLALVPAIILRNGNPVTPNRGSSLFQAFRLWRQCCEM